MFYLLQEMFQMGYVKKVPSSQISSAELNVTQAMALFLPICKLEVASRLHDFLTIIETHCDSKYQKRPLKMSNGYYFCNCVCRNSWRILGSRKRQDSS